MVKWKFWQRNADTTTDAELPPEVQEYYESTQRGRKGIAILLAIVTVIVTLLLAAVLYFAGRYVWQKFFDDNNEPTPISQQEVAPTDEPADTTPNPDATTDNDADNNSDSSNSADNTDDDTDDQTDENTGTSSTSTDSDGSAAQNDASNDDDNGKETSPSSPNEVPDTGPGEVFAIAILAAVASGIGYELRARRNKSTQ